MPTPPNDVIEKAKKQATRVIRVHGVTPASHLACITSLLAQPISVLLVDPPPPAHGVHWDFDENNFFREYYKGIKLILEQGPPMFRVFQNSSFAVTPLLTVNKRTIQLGLLSEIYERPERAPLIVGELEFQRSDNNSIGKDGIAVFMEPILENET